MFGPSGNKMFEKLLDKATSQMQLEIDWESILQMCDVVRQGDAQPKFAINLIKKKLNNENINVINYTLHTLESMVKNCGSKIHQEIATRDFMDAMKNIALTKPDPVKIKVLELIQCWMHAFKKNPNYKVVEDYYNAMKLEGFVYPVLKESEAMFDVEQAPEWKDDVNCYRCRAEFTTLRRKHHCRCCGQVFCNNCSSKSSSIPKFGIEKEVRVCDTCYDKLRPGSNPSSSASDSPISQVPKIPQGTQPRQQEKTDEEFEEELQLALALSQSEQEEKEKKRKPHSSTSVTQSQSKNSQQQQQNGGLNSFASLRGALSNIEANDSELNSYLTRATAASVKQDMNKVASISGPSPPPSAPYVEHRSVEESAPVSNEHDSANEQMNQFVDEVKKCLEIFVNRMKSDSMRGRSITNDTAVQSLFLQLQQYQPKLLGFIKYQEDGRAYYESLQDKLTQLKDAREALNALRHDFYEKKKREFEERERQRQIAIAQKLQHMRQQKQSYYQYQNDLNIRRLQEQERDSHLRLEQQRQLVMMRDQQFASLSFQPPNQVANMINNPYVNPQHQYYPGYGQNQPQVTPTTTSQPHVPLSQQQQQQQVPMSQLQHQQPHNNFGVPQFDPNGAYGMAPPQSSATTSTSAPTPNTTSSNPSAQPAQVPFNNITTSAYNMSTMSLPPMQMSGMPLNQMGTMGYNQYSAGPGQWMPNPQMSMMYGGAPAYQQIPGTQQQMPAQTGQVHGVAEAQLISFD